MTATRPGTAAAPTKPSAAPGGPRRSRRRVILVAAAVAVLAVILVWVVAFSPVLGVRTVRVDGASSVGAAQVRSVAAIASGTPLVRLDTAAVARRVETIPAVASASVRTAYPNTVVITIVERIAVGYVESGGAYALIDRTGDQFRTVAARPRRLPQFALPSGAQARAAGAAVASVASALPESLRAKVASIEAFDANSITLLLTDHRVVAWGSAQSNAQKAQVLPTLLTQPGTQFDVSNPDQVVAH